MIFEESNLRFEFDPDHWEVIKYDEKKDFFRIRNAVPKTKAVDFVGIKDNEILVLMEVKNFRGHRIENKPRIEQGKDLLDVEFAQKIKDSISGIVGGCRHSTHHKSIFHSALNLIKSQKNKVVLLLWLEEDLPQHTQPIERKRRRRNVLINELKKRGRWLSSNVFIASCKDNPYSNSLIVNFI